MTNSYPSNSIALYSMGTICTHYITHAHTVKVRKRVAVCCKWMIAQHELSAGAGETGTISAQYTTRLSAHSVHMESLQSPDA